jgi:hypothetical protein
MRTEHDRAFKEWAVACAAMREGKQILLIRKGGIREESGVFTVNDPEFFLMPTYEHQNARLLEPEWVARLAEIQAAPHDPNAVTLDSYAVVDTVLVARNDAQVNAVRHETPWNETYVKERFDFNPYDPLYLLVLRVYNLPEAVTLPLLPEYVGCKSWVTLERPLSTLGATPALSEAEFARRRDALLTTLNSLA